jgi:hypothetical protein
MINREGKLREAGVGYNSKKPSFSDIHIWDLLQKIGIQSCIAVLTWFDSDHQKSRGVGDLLSEWWDLSLSFHNLSEERQKEIYLLFHNIMEWCQIEQ